MGSKCPPGTGCSNIMADVRFYPKGAAKVSWSQLAVPENQSSDMYGYVRIILCIVTSLIDITGTNLEISARLTSLHIMQKTPRRQLGPDIFSSPNAKQKSSTSSELFDEVGGH